MSEDKESKLKPRDGHTLQVGLIARISGCQGQSESSLDTQNDHNKLFVSEIYQGPVEFDTIATKGKGESLTRDELTEIEKKLRTHCCPAISRTVSIG
jgi:site-specific DNA recombinase